MALPHGPHARFLHNKLMIFFEKPLILQYENNIKKITAFYG
jgi:hypothetical protein